MGHRLRRAAGGGEEGEEMTDDIANGVAILREIETRWIAEALAEAISNLGYPVGMGIAPKPEHLDKAAGKLFDRYAAMIEMAARKRERAP